MTRNVTRKRRPLPVLALSLTIDAVSVAFVSVLGAVTDRRIAAAGSRVAPGDPKHCWRVPLSQLSGLVARMEQT